MRGRSTWGIPAVFLALASLSLLAAPAPGKGKAAKKKKAGRVYLEDDEGQIVDKEEPEETTVIVVIGFRVKGIPVLVGYRMPEQHLAAWKAVLEEIIASVSLAKPAGSTGSEKK
jgi:hypothetical protein